MKLSKLFLLFSLATIYLPPLLALDYDLSALVHKRRVRDDGEAKHADRDGNTKKFKRLKSTLSPQQEWANRNDLLSNYRQTRQKKFKVSADGGQRINLGNENPANSLEAVTFRFPESELTKELDKFASLNPGATFLKHVAHFAQNGDINGKISLGSICQRWYALNAFYAPEAFLKAAITHQGTNNDAQAKGCQFARAGYKWSFAVAETCEALNHPCDLGVVNPDGTINLLALELVLHLTAKKYNGAYVVPKSAIDALLPYTSRWDDEQDLAGTNGCLMPSNPLLARSEWVDAYKIYTGYWIINEEGQENTPAFTLENFLQFYFEPQELNNLVMRGSLPVVQPED